MSKTKLSAAEWKLVKDAPYWVNAALAAADGKVSFFTRRREDKALARAIDDYKTDNVLVNDIIADDSDASNEIEKASQADAEKALNRIAGIVNTKLGPDDLGALKDFLSKIGHAVASSSKEGGAGNARAMSEKESAALVGIESAMKIGSSYATAHTVTQSPAPKPQSSSAKPAPAPAKRDDDAKAREEAEKKQAEARERLENARKEAEAKAVAKKDAEAKERLEKARQEAEQRQREATAEREAREKAEAEAAKAREEAARKEAEAKAAAEQAAAKPRYTQFIAEHTVQPGDNLSFISERYYGTQANFRIIYEANREVIGDNMSLIRPGQVLKIPKL